MKPGLCLTPGEILLGVGSGGPSEREQGDHGGDDTQDEHAHVATCAGVALGLLGGQSHGLAASHERTREALGTISKLCIVSPFVGAGYKGRHPETPHDHGGPAGRGLVGGLSAALAGHLRLSIPATVNMLPVAL